MIKAMHSWFHAAHHVTRGTGFSGDHALLYSDIYQALEDNLDGTIEKTIGLTGDAGVADPAAILKGACDILSDYRSPVGLGATEIALHGLKIEKDFVRLTEILFRGLEATGSLSLGLNDFFAATANQHETFVYKLQQRVQVEIGS
jgi:hypothetical protein